MSCKDFIIGVDIGGTWVRALLLETSKGSIKEKIKEPVDTRSNTALSEQIIKMTNFFINSIEL